VVSASNKIRLGNPSVTVIEGQVDFTFTSDMTKKENFQPVDGEEVLRKLSTLNLTSWNYIGHDPKQFRHYGPMGQEFFRLRERCHRDHRKPDDPHGLRCCGNPYERGPGTGAPVGGAKCGD